MPGRERAAAGVQPARWQQQRTAVYEKNWYLSRSAEVRYVA